MAITKYGPPEIMNTDQGSQFSGSAWITTLSESGVKISMDGRGRYLDNIFIERLRRSLKQEAVYLHELTDGFVAERVISEWITFYNTDRPNIGIGGITPIQKLRNAARIQLKRPVKNGGLPHDRLVELLLLCFVSDLAAGAAAFILFSQSGCFDPFSGAS